MIHKEDTSDMAVSKTEVYKTLFGHKKRRLRKKSIPENPDLYQSVIWHEDRIICLPCKRPRSWVLEHIKLFHFQLQHVQEDANGKMAWYLGDDEREMLIAKTKKHI